MKKFIEHLSTQGIFASVVNQIGQFESDLDSRWRVEFLTALPTNDSHIASRSETFSKKKTPYFRRIRHKPNIAKCYPCI